ncbi:MAG: hypothetical protein JWP87_5649 [Labilithrix sp.]|nr:hypothetical protein [Labilithrix sp.]
MERRNAKRCDEVGRQIHEHGANAEPVGDAPLPVVEFDDDRLPGGKEQLYGSEDCGLPGVTGANDAG